MAYCSVGCVHGSVESFTGQLDLGFSGKYNNMHSVEYSENELYAFEIVTKSILVGCCGVSVEPQWTAAQCVTVCAVCSSYLVCVCVSLRVLCCVCQVLPAAWLQHPLHLWYRRVWDSNRDQGETQSLLLTVV